MSVEEPDFDWDEAIDHLREDVECAKSSVEDKLKKRIKKLREKLAPNTLDEDRKQKCVEKLNQLLELETVLEELDRDDILKFALRNKKTWEELESTSDVPSERMLFKIATKDDLISAVEEFHKNYPHLGRKEVRRRLGMMNGREASNVKKLKNGHGIEIDESNTGSGNSEANMETAKKSRQEEKQEKLKRHSMSLRKSAASSDEKNPQKRSKLDCDDGQAKQKKAKISRAKKETKPKDPSDLREICEAVFANRPLSTPALCNVCNIRLSLTNRDMTAWKTDSIIEHACLHLGKIMYKCKYCDFESTAKCSMLYHIFNVHELEIKDGQDLDDVSAGHENEIADWIRNCFGQETTKNMDIDQLGIQETETSDSSVPVYESVLLFQRHRLCSEFMNLPENRGGKFTCGLCSNVVIAERVRPAMEHVHTHLTKPLYRCNSCPWTGRTYHAVIKHQKRCHDAVMMPGNFEDETDKCHAEIMYLIRKVFGKRQPGVEANENGIIHMQDSQLMSQRRIFISGFVKLAKSQGGKITCGLCSRTCDVTRVHKAMQHAICHLQEPMYRCKICSETGPSYSAMLKHLKDRHSLTMTGNYEDRSDQYHEEIMDKIKKIFGKVK